MKRKYLFIYILFICYISCKHSEIVEHKGFIINETIITTCTNDTNHKYIVYLPNQYDSTQVWPVIFCFDPQGEAEKPIDSLKEAAERYGYILVASKKIKNKIDHLNNDLNNLNSDVLNKLSIDGNKLYACGFSGGARIASKIVSNSKSFKGVINCGAGINQNLKFNSKQKVFCIIGNEDFNYMEVIKSFRQLPNIALITFNGDHKWPNKNYLSEVLRWWYIQEHPEKAKSQYKSIMHEINIRQKTSIEKAYELTRNSIIMLNDLVNIKDLKKEKFKLQRSQAYKNFYDVENQVFNQESQLQAFYYNAFVKNDTIWWKNEISKLNEPSSSNDIHYIHMKKRILNFISMISYMFTSQAIENNDLNAVNKYLIIYELTDENNPDYLFFKAVYYDRIKNIQASRLYLEKAIKEGFNKTEEARSKLSYEIIL